MNFASPVAWAVLILLLLKWAVQMGLERLNQRSVRAQADAVPDIFKGIINPATYANSVQYTLARGRLSQCETTYHLIVVLAVLGSGVLPWGYDLATRSLGNSAGAMAGFLFGTGLAFACAGLPWDWHSQFRLEERFGFNTTTQKLWWLDRLKGLGLALLLGYPLLVLILKTVEWTGPSWWLWACASVLGFQMLMTVLAPVLILPLFNKLTPLPDGGLRERLLALAEQTGFHVGGIQIMDGSKRSRHSNAFFTGFGRLRKIVLFDTLIQQLTEPELAAVVAHEVGHYKLKHVPKMLAWSAASLFAAFYTVSWLAGQDGFYRAFGFEPGNIGPALLLFALLSGAITFWLEPLANLWSRRFEYQADTFAAAAVRETHSLIGALRKLNEQNLGNLTPHRLYSGFYYSHPTLPEREQALIRIAGASASGESGGDPAVTTPCE